MVWSCPKCSFKTDDYKEMQSHYKSEHGKSKSQTKGQSKTVYKYKPPRG